MKYRKRPIVIEALRFDGTNGPEIETWAGQVGTNKGVVERHDASGNNAGVIRIDTLEGTMNALVGDWVIKGIKGEFYPCRDDIFAATYEPVTEL